MFVDLQDNEINYLYDADLSKVEQDHSYVMVYEDLIDSSNATPVSTIVLNNIVYFKSAKEHAIGPGNSVNYNLYYGRDYIKYIKPTSYYNYDIDETVYSYIQYDQSTISYYLTGNNSQDNAILSATPSDVNLYQDVVNKNSSENYTLTFFNDGVDWVDNKSTKAETKVIGNFNGPIFKLIGNIGPDYGMFKYRISTKSNSNQQIEQVVVDWTDVDCYFSSGLLESELLDISNLGYEEYIIEIETLYDKNVLSYGNNILIKEIQFLKNYNISLGEELINPDLSFISIGGVK